MRRPGDACFLKAILMQHQLHSTAPETKNVTGTLLVTDDSLIIRQIIKDMATNAGWTVIGEAADGREAIERYRQLRPMP